MVENHRFPIKLFCILSTIEAIIAFIFLVQIPTDPKNVFFAGLSINRLVILGFILIIFGISLFLLLRNRINLQEAGFIISIRRFFSKKDWLYFLLIFISWVGIIFPAYRFGKYEVIYSRLQPLVILIFSIFLTFLILLKFRINKERSDVKSIINFKLFLIISLIIGAVWIFLITTRIGLDIDHDFWGGAATPILPMVLYISILIPLLFSSFLKCKNDENENWFVKIFPFLLFFTAIIIWNLEPFTPHFFAPKIQPPNYEYYPYSDAQIYDMTAQSLLNGEGYMNRGFVQRPLYGFMLFLFHQLVGQEYLHLIFLQTVLYAFFPVLLFYLGKKLFSPTIGISLGVLSILRELTAFQASAFMEIVHSKLYMTDNWAGFSALLMTFLGCVWFFEKKENHLLLILIGAISGISLLLRLNLLLVFIPIFLVVFFKNKTHIKTRFLRIGILGVSIFIILLPWMVRNYYQIGEFGIEPQKFRMVIDTRFEIEDSNDSIETGSSKPAQMVMPEINKNRVIDKIDARNILNIVRFTTANFLHNEVHSVLIFPNSIFVESTKGVIKQNDFIQEAWTGEINSRQFIAIIINLVFIGLGISLSYKKFGWFGLFPLSIHLFYNLSNGIARVSGWRYVIVTDWVVIMYYLAGICLLLYTLLHKIGLIDFRLGLSFNMVSNSTHKDEEPVFPKPVLWVSIAFVVLLSLGMLMPELLIAKKYEGEISKEVLLEKLISNNFLEEASFVEGMAEDPDLVFIHTKAFYPRYYDPGKGEPGNNIEWLIAKEEGNLGFMIVSPNVAGASMKLDKSPVYFPNNEEVYIIGKWVESINMKYINCQLIFFPEKNEIIYSN